MSEKGEKLLSIDLYTSAITNASRSGFDDDDNFSDNLLTQAYDQFISLSKCDPNHEQQNLQDSMPDQKNATENPEPSSLQDLITLEDLLGTPSQDHVILPIFRDLNESFIEETYSDIEELLNDLVSKVSQLYEMDTISDLLRSIIKKVSKTVEPNREYDQSLLFYSSQENLNEQLVDVVANEALFDVIGNISVSEINNELDLGYAEQPTPSNSSNIEPNNMCDLSEASTNVTIIIVEMFDIIWKKIMLIKRWRKAAPETWKRNVVRKRRADGLPYETNKKARFPKVPKPIDCSKCTFQCTEMFSEDYRMFLCRKYWSLDFAAKKNFILANIEIRQTKTALIARKRTTQRAYTTHCSFKKDAEKVKVCQAFFCKTLSVSQSVIANAVKLRDSMGHCSVQKDPRGQHVPSNKTPQSTIEEVKNHIESFPTMESHYIRKDTQRKYLDSKLSIGKMFGYYAEECEKKGTKPVSETTYRRIFCNDYNLGFFLPKKDQCLVYTRYERDQSADLKEEYEQHMNRKRACNEEKDKDKDRAKVEKNFLSASFDLQAILQIPSGDVGLLYYTRKLTIYNLTVYESALPNEAYCFTWSEINGKKGSSEIGSILLHYLSSCVPSHITEVSLFSDTCGGQNRNKYVAAVLLRAAQKIDNLNIIEQKFLESGHSYMEADSMHSSIESAQKYTSIYSMNEWINVFKRARSKTTYKKGTKKVAKQSYHVKEFKYNEFKDLKQLAGRILQNSTKNIDGNRVQWLKIKRLKYVKNDSKIYYNYDMSNNFLVIDPFIEQQERQTQMGNHSYSTRNRSKRLNINSLDISTASATEEYGFPELVQLYDAPLTISEAKKKDLVNLCAKRVIPEEYHGWYLALKTGSSQKDKVPDLCVSDEEPISSDED